jgi:hypothetical protein
MLQVIIVQFTVYIEYNTAGEFILAKSISQFFLSATNTSKDIEY